MQHNLKILKNILYENNLSFTLAGINFNSAMLGFYGNKKTVKQRERTGFEITRPIFYIYNCMDVPAGVLKKNKFIKEKIVIVSHQLWRQLIKSFYPQLKVINLERNL